VKIRKAVIPAAGLGTRVLPASKSMPKEMLPIVDKPAIQYIVEEAVSSGIEEILIITSRGKTTVEDHFDRNPELEERLLLSGKQREYDSMLSIANMAALHYVRQKQPLGLGHAVYQARSFVGDEPFAVLYGDDVIISQNPACAQLCAAYEKHGAGIAGIKQVSKEAIHKYSSLGVEYLEGNLYKITDMIEKPPHGKELSLFSILGRCVLPPKIFPILENLPKGAGGEIQLTDAMRILTLSDGMLGLEYEGTRYDMGSKLGYMQANVELAAKHPEIGKAFTEYIKAWAADL